MSNVPVLSRDPHSPVETVLIFTAVAALLPGTAVCLLDRDWGSSMFLEPFIGYDWPRYAVFGAFGGCLPSLLHAYAICLLIMVALWPWQRTRPWVCLLCFVLASFLEWLQSNASDAWIVACERLAGDIPLMAYFKRHAFQGQFDDVDVLATGVGCLTALAITIAMAPHSRQRTQA